MLYIFALCLFWAKTIGLKFLDEAKVFPMSLKTILYKVFICIFWFVMDIIPGNSRKKHTCWKINGLSHDSKSVIWSTKWRKKLPHQFFHTKSVMLPVLALKVLKHIFWFMRRESLPKIASSWTLWIQWGFSVLVNKDLEADLEADLLIWHISVKCYFFLIQFY